VFDFVLRPILPRLARSVYPLDGWQGSWQGQSGFN